MFETYFVLRLKYSTWMTIAVIYTRLVTCKLPTCVNLQVLDLTTNFYVREIPFIVSMPKLVYLSLEWCIGLVPDSVTAVLSEEHVCPNIKILNLRRCETFTALNMVAIVIAHLSLEKVDISYTSEFNVSCILNMISLKTRLFPNFKDFVFSPDLYENSEKEWDRFHKEFPYLRFEFMTKM